MAAGFHNAPATKLAVGVFAGMSLLAGSTKLALPLALGACRLGGEG